jgi:hypothetical protein
MMIVITLPAAHNAIAADDPLERTLSINIIPRAASVTMAAAGVMSSSTELPLAFSW